MLHRPVEGVVGVKVAHALEVERFGPCFVDNDVLKVGGGYVLFLLGRLLRWRACQSIAPSRAAWRNAHLDNLLWLRRLCYRFNVCAYINVNIVSDISHVRVVHDGGYISKRSGNSVSWCCWKFESCTSSAPRSVNSKARAGTNVITCVIETPRHNMIARFCVSPPTIA